MIAYLIFKERNLIVEWSYSSIQLFDGINYLLADIEVNGQTLGLSAVETNKTKIVYTEQEIEEWGDIFTIAKLAGNYSDDHNAYRNYSGMNIRVLDLPK